MLKLFMQTISSISFLICCFGFVDVSNYHAFGFGLLIIFLPTYMATSMDNTSTHGVHFCCLYISTLQSLKWPMFYTLHTSLLQLYFNFI
jgi:hypothetical protein